MYKQLSYEQPKLIKNTSPESKIAQSNTISTKSSSVMNSNEIMKNINRQIEEKTRENKGRCRSKDINPGGNKKYSDKFLAQVDVSDNPNVLEKNPHYRDKKENRNTGHNSAATKNQSSKNLISKISDFLTDLNDKKRDLKSMNQPHLPQQIHQPHQHLHNPHEHQNSMPNRKELIKQVSQDERFTGILSRQKHRSGTVAYNDFSKQKSDNLTGNYVNTFEREFQDPKVNDKYNDYKYKERDLQREREIQLEREIQRERELQRERDQRERDIQREMREREERDRARERELQWERQLIREKETQMNKQSQPVAYINSKSGGLEFELNLNQNKSDEFSNMGNINFNNVELKSSTSSKVSDKESIRKKIDMAIASKNKSNYNEIEKEGKKRPILNKGGGGEDRNGYKYH